jgi:streptogramin lyase
MGFAVACAASLASIWLSPATSPPTELIHLGGGHPGATALADGSVWVTVYGGRGRNRVVGIDPATGRVKARIPVPGGPFYIAASDSAVWVTGNFTRRGDVLHRLDPVAKRVVATIPLPGRFAGPVAVGSRSVWVLATNHDVTRQWLVRIDSATNEIVRSVPLGAVKPWYVEDLDVSRGFVWLLAVRVGKQRNLPGDVVRFDPRANRVTARIKAEAIGMEAGPGGMWVTGCVDCGSARRRAGSAQRVDLRASRVVGPRLDPCSWAAA